MGSAFDPSAQCVYVTAYLSPPPPPRYTLSHRPKLFLVAL